MKNLFITGLFLYQTILFSQTTYSGILDHTSGYFTINPFGSTYDDGTFAKIFYDGNSKRLNFWNSDNNTTYTNLRAGVINGHGYITVDKNGSYRVAMNGQSNGYITGRNDNIEDKFLIHSNGPTYFNGGNVGIGTTSPTEKLDVNGKTIVNSLRIDSNNSTSSVNGFSNRMEFTTGGHAAIVFHPGELDELMFGMHNNGNFYWGTGSSATNPNYYSMYLNGNNGDLGIKGKLTSNEVKVKLGGWSDFVFEDTYTLPTLEEVELHIKEKGHLKDIPSAKDVEENGIYLGDMNAKLLQKIEELTLYAIEQEKDLKKVKELENKVQALEEENKVLKEVSAKLIEFQIRLEKMESKSKN